MKEEIISVTEAARNFSDVVSRVRYQGMTFVLQKNGVPVAQIVPKTRRPTKGAEVAKALHEALKGAHLSKQEATAWLHDLEEARKKLPPQADKWQS